MLICAHDFHNTLKYLSLCCTMLEQNMETFILLQYIAVDCVTFRKGHWNSTCPPFIDLQTSLFQKGTLFGQSQGTEDSHMMEGPTFS